MSDADYLVDRRRLSRRVAFWRAAAFLVALAAILGAAFVFKGDGDLGAPGQAHIAKVKISGFIFGDDRTLDLLKHVGESRARAALVEIDSPGGTVTGSERLYDALRDLSSRKPTVAVVNGMAASGAYVAAMGTDHIVALQTSLVGSVGVLFQIPNVVGLLDKIGVSVEITKSAPLKASPNPFERTSPEAEAALRAVVASSYDWFKDLVAQRRGLDPGELSAVTDGRVFTGSQGLPLRLVDELGSQREAIAWLEREKGVPAELPVREWKPRAVSEFGLFSAAAAIAAAAGAPDLAALLQAAARVQPTPALDGPLAVWHP